MDHIAIQASLENRLDALATTLGLPLNTENSDFQPTADSSYLSPAFLPAMPFAAALGELALNRCIGIYQVTASFPRGEGRGPALSAATAVANYFPRGMRLTFNGTTVLITSSGVLPGQRSDSAYSVPAEIHWQTDQPN